MPCTLPTWVQTPGTLGLQSTARPLSPEHRAWSKAGALPAVATSSQIITPIHQHNHCIHNHHTITRNPQTPKGAQQHPDTSRSHISIRVHHKVAQTHNRPQLHKDEIAHVNPALRARPSQGSMNSHSSEIAMVQIAREAPTQQNPGLDPGRASRLPPGRGSPRPVMGTARCRGGFWEM